MPVEFIEIVILHCFLQGKYYQPAPWTKPLNDRNHSLAGYSFSCTITSNFSVMGSS